MISPVEVMEFLQGYDIDATETVASENVTASHAVGEITVGGAIEYEDGTMVQFTGSDIPAPLVAGTTYYAVSVSTTKIKLATTYANAIAGTTITLTDSGSGTITLSKIDYLHAPLAWIEKRITNFIVPFVERITRQSFDGTTQVTEYYSGQGKNILILRRRPIITLDEVSYVLGGSNLTILNLNNIEVIAAEGILKAKRNYEESYYLPVFAKGDRNVKVKYTYGYANTPDDIGEAITYLAAEQLLGFLGARTGGGSLTMQSYGRSYGNRGKYQDIRNDLARQASAILRRYQTAVV